MYSTHTCPEGGSLPVVIVVGEAREARQAAVVALLQPLLLLPFLLPPPDLVVQLRLPVYFLRSLPDGQNRERVRERGDVKMTSAPIRSAARNHSAGNS